MKTGRIDIKSVLLRPPGFWFFQVTGWAVFAVAMKLYFPKREVVDLLSFYEFFMFYFIAFLLTSGLRLIYKRIFREEKHILLIVVTMVFASAVLMILLAVLEGLANYPFVDENERSKLIDTWRHFDPGQFYYTNIFWYVILLMWSVLYFAIKARKDLVDTRERGEKALLLAQQSQLHMLRYQLNPHFLFNSLNSIQALIYEDPDGADRMILKLSEFLRYTLRNQDRLMIPLAEEAKIVEEYLELERIRFPERLRYSINITEEAARKEVVAFMLQPFAENAVKHGMKSSPDNLEISINASYKNGRLAIEIMNNGQWIESGEDGIGVRNVSERLQNAFPGHYSLTVSKEGGFVTVIITIEQ